ncbi:cobalamin biosynthetic protein CobC [Natronospira proteinivora]|uniref:threonine-phosphate decarboxylase n=1 Tax=Natronospira proteinivora TaxID=1807133 RepID=A0ABT1G7A3_9GAMM|nr:threonine-phosphate decarboxylase CobD [Natronospira proteinivora]MCP1726835.1 cobalamin biosynthetic protein CobC [Natronospira proteinivora]
MALEHGGRIKAAARAIGIPEDQWLDLSTGISPWSWPPPPIPDSVWRRLPEDDDGLEDQARHCLGVPDAAGLQALAGSQQAIMRLPELRPFSRVGVPMPGYREHAHCWQQAGHQVVDLSREEVPQALPELDVLVWIHPNNPSGEIVPVETLLAWWEQLQVRGGWLIVDEAFVEASDAESLISQTGREGLIVLRSVGKFFGLAGLRGGFMAGPPSLCQALAQAIGPWAVSGPARWLMRQALTDKTWQVMQKKRLQDESRALVSLLMEKGFHPVGGTALFQTVRHDDPRHVEAALRQQGVLVRAFDEAPWLRFGLPGGEARMLRAARALDSVLPS